MRGQVHGPYAGWPFWFPKMSCVAFSCQGPYLFHADGSLGEINVLTL